MAPGDVSNEASTSARGSTMDKLFWTCPDHNTVSATQGQQFFMVLRRSWPALRM